MTKVVAGLVAVGLYVGWSSYRIHQLRGDLEKEKRRIYMLADGFELLQSVSKNDCSFNVDVLPRSRLLYVEEVKRPEALSALPKGSRLFLYSLDMDDKKKEEYDRKYRGEDILRYERQPREGSQLGVPGPLTPLVQVLRGSLGLHVIHAPGQALLQQVCAVEPLVRLLQLRGDRGTHLRAALVRWGRWRRQPEGTALYEAVRGNPPMDNTMMM